MSSAEKITRDDLEGKFRELRGEVDTTAKQVKGYAIVAGAVGLLVVVGVAFFFGQRKGKKKSTVVEVRRI